MAKNREHPPLVLDEMGREDHQDARPAREAERPLVDPDLPQVGEREDGVAEGMRGAMDQHPLEAAALGGVDGVGLEGEIRQQMPEKQPPKDHHATSRSD